MKLIKVTTQKKACDLKIGQHFKLPEQRKLRRCYGIWTMKKTDKISRSEVGKLLVCYDGCKQMILRRTQMIDILNIKKSLSINKIP